MKHTVLAFSKLSPALTEQLQQEFHVLQVNPKLGNAEQQLIELLPQADGLIGAGRQLDATLLQHAHKLKVVSSVTVGFDNYDVDYLTQRNILLTNTPDVLTETTADLGFALLMAAARRVAELDAWTKQGNWKKTVQPEHYGVDVYAKTIGIIGLGNIGAAIAKRAHFGFDMPVLYTGQTRKPELEQRFNAIYCTLEQLLQQSDFVSVNVALNAQTTHLIGKTQLAQMKPSAILLNVARGAVVDEAALIEALKNKQILAAGLDVYEQEPLQQSELFKLKNVVTLPHLGSATQQTRDAMSNLAFDNLKAALNGQKPRYMVNPQVWQV